MNTEQQHPMNEQPAHVRHSLDRLLGYLSEHINAPGDEPAEESGHSGFDHQ